MNIQAKNRAKRKAEEEARQAEIARIAELRKDNKVVTDSIINGGTTTINTTTDIYGVMNKYKKVVHDWGQVYYYKNEAIVSEAIYVQDLKSAREELP